MFPSEKDIPKGWLNHQTPGGSQQHHATWPIFVRGRSKIWNWCELNGQEWIYSMYTVHIYIYTYTHVCVYIYIYICMYVGGYIYIYICMYKYTVQDYIYHLIEIRCTQQTCPWRYVSVYPSCYAEFTFPQRLEVTEWPFSAFWLRLRNPCADGFNMASLGWIPMAMRQNARSRRKHQMLIEFLVFVCIKAKIMDMIVITNVL